jgi:hypothetical protein
MHVGVHDGVPVGVEGAGEDVVDDLDPITTVAGTWPAT